MSKYRVRRCLPGNDYVQLKSATMADCKALLKSIKGKWDDLAHMGSFGGGEPYETKIDKSNLIVLQGDRIVDKYVIEPT